MWESLKGYVTSLQDTLAGILLVNHATNVAKLVRKCDWC